MRCGDWLVTHTLQQPSGIGWPIEAKIAPQPLTGFAHGAAGIAFALTQLAIATGKEQYMEIALDAVQYEQSTFLPTINNWPDFREFKYLHGHPPTSQPQAMIAWCHGGAGIGLGRIQMGQFLSDPSIHKDIETALELVTRFDFTINHSLCHGALGNLELLVQSALNEGQTEWKPVLEQAVISVLLDIRINGWRTGTPAEIEVPGLMTGIAGIGYQLLRLVSPDRVPSVLLLEPPIVRENASKSDVTI
jgi:lantibiotic modifying enzyme